MEGYINTCTHVKGYMNCFEIMFSHEIMVTPNKNKYSLLFFLLSYAALSYILVCHSLTRELEICNVFIYLFLLLRDMKSWFFTLSHFLLLKKLASVVALHSLNKCFVLVDACVYLQMIFYLISFPIWSISSCSVKKYHLVLKFQGKLVTFKK